MKRNALGIGCLLVFGLAAEAAELVFQVVQPASTQRQLNWWPKGTKVPLSSAEDSDRLPLWRTSVDLLIDASFGGMKLGLPNAAPVPIALGKKAPSRKRHERLLVDANQDGRINSETR